MADEYGARQRHPFIGVGFWQWMGLLAGHGVRPAYWGRAASVTFYSALLTGRRLRERIGPDRAAEACRIEAPPVFILGHWRSGTTYLQNVLAKSPDFGYLNLIQSLFPTIFLSTEERLGQRMRVRRREMDNVALSPDSPSEEEIALAVLAPGSFWHGYYFPRQMDHFFRKYVLLEGIAAWELAAFRDAYLYLLKKLTYHHGGKPLLLKNPPNTCRIAFLLGLFPEAKFIHIYRNPFRVFASRMAQYDTSVLSKAFQPITSDEWEARVLAYYTAMMDKHFDERRQVPEGQYAEVRFEAFCRDPMGEIERIYETLDLPGLDRARPHFEGTVEGLAGYRQNRHPMDPATIEKVTRHWGATIERWGYDTPEAV